MSICPNHGGYTGDSCKKCVARLEEDISSLTTTTAPPKKEWQETNKQPTATLGPPSLDDSDKLTLVKLENASLKSFHAMQNAQAQFQGFAKAMFEKYKVKPGEYTLDMEKLEFVVRGM